MNMNQLLMQSMAETRGLCHPDCVKASKEQEDYDASQHAAMVAVNLISSARVIFNLDAVRTEYSAQYLVDNAGKEDDEGEIDQQSSQLTFENILQYMVENVWNKREDVQGEREQHLTVKDCLECAFKNGLPRREHWSHVGCTFKAPPFTCHIPRVPMKGEVIETKTVDEAMKLLMKQPVGARLHLFSPEIDRVREGIYDGPSSNGSSYVGLRDAMIVAVDKSEEKFVVKVQICYKKKTSIVKVCMRRMFVQLDGDEESQVKEPTGLLVDFCIPRLSVN
ncbi:unnamed protein product [Arabidopsis lyrata]|uniref:Predicted protein n=1 Tax=Arabidopsis lyrata subsp. lyrata TaxID=81972 RepID=D7LXQ9_ARALL|nr:protein HEAT-INDUCED TAS1 TARGET 4 [Arabidopsis lyrata subsp. lyrata]XP_020877799.1 protein HEAT-INDUCED TAS1 TARGET 4 [Arabidopsis lyrata subsp. lyrata]EFH48055.1 predicted protein [Arabidopsis lyrata subsp. lyrata]CAH8271461.1 unnamed protein product [Arabidopsis lyrata]|eukprot:XP_002871796.1 protein HEAT-INDUCED TAS1 TARGET 4 [Arabidopsis lyrata subsp. lyrata]